MDLPIPSPQAEDFLNTQKPFQEQEAAELDEIDRAVAPPREASDDPVQPLHQPPDDHDIEDPSPDDGDFDLSP